MATKLREYGAKVNGETYPCKVNDNIYKQEGIAQALGFISPGTADVNYNGVGDFKSLRKAGAIIRVRVTGVKVENGADKKKSWQLWCVASNLSNAKGQLPTKKIDGYDISTVSNTLTTRFR
jgi:hypothetical protein